VMPPLTIDEDGLRHGLDTIAAALDEVPAPAPAEVIGES
jgi:hypothetical protein